VCTSLFTWIKVWLNPALFFTPVFSAIQHSHRDPNCHSSICVPKQHRACKIFRLRARACSWMHSPITNFLLIHLPGTIPHTISKFWTPLCNSVKLVFCRYTSSNGHSFSNNCSAC
jgi:hypothetical protein